MKTYIYKLISFNSQCDAFSKLVKSNLPLIIPAVIIVIRLIFLNMFEHSWEDLKGFSDFNSSSLGFSKITDWDKVGVDFF